MTSGVPSNTRIGRLHQVMADHVRRGAVPGLVMLVSRRGDTQVDVIGNMGVGAADPIRRDTIFRISSMTKPITAAAAMLLIEDSKLHLDEPVDRWLPELAKRRVLRRLDGPIDDTVPARRAITLRDLLSFRLGFGLIWGPQDAYPIQKAAKELQLVAFGPPQPAEPPAPDEWLRRFATLPLMHQPGEAWLYNTGFELLGVLIARAAGQPLEAFMRERIFEPLGMKDTAFSVPESKLARLPTSYMANSKTGTLDLFDDAANGQWSRPPAFPSGAGGLVSTIDDYFAFGEMMLNEGNASGGGKRILSKASVQAMTTDQLTPEQKAASNGSLAPGFWDAHGWGFGVSITLRPDDVTGAAGMYGWTGGLGTSWASDPKRSMVAILMTQVSAYPAAWNVYRDFWKTTYETASD
jgi:CubicO group peptidase (beta-lactamase class C family)